MKDKLRQWARALKQDVMTLWFACRHQGTPLIAKMLAVMTVAYALSPIDLIPDFIPVLGYLDDVIILPVMIYITVRLIPETVLKHCRSQAEEWIAARHAKPRSYAGAIAIVALWLFLLALSIWIFL